MTEEGLTLYASGAIGASRAADERARVVLASAPSPPAMLLFYFRRLYRDFPLPSPALSPAKAIGSFVADDAEASGGGRLRTVASVPRI